MDSITDPRHQKRVKLMQDLFASTFSKSNFENYKKLSAGTEVGEILDQLEELDAKIQLVAPERPLDQINPIDLAILRLIYHEQLTKKTPIKVLINEAVELAKEFGSDSSSKFVNGALAKLLLEDK